MEMYKKIEEKDVPITILCGGAQEEREVSLSSGRAVYLALKEGGFEVDLVELKTDDLPDFIDGERTIVFPAMHGTFGEDGELQSILDAAGIIYVGSDAESSELCMNKIATKCVGREVGIRMVNDMHFNIRSKPSGEEVVKTLGDHVVFKPWDKGSSIEIHFAKGLGEIERLLSALEDMNWMIEPYIPGVCMTVGILHGKSLGCGKILPNGGIYDYRHKYTPGLTQYIFPADVSEALTLEMKESAEKIFAACGCRDFARVDYRLSEKDGKLYFMEINTIPGLTATSLLPKSAFCEGYDFVSLVEAMVLPAMNRFKAREKVLESAK